MSSYRGGADSQESLTLNRRNRRAGGGGGGSIHSTSSANNNMYQPGTPIGYLAARGTPYERKYFTRKLGFCCLAIAPGIILVTLVLTLVPILYAIGEHAIHTSQFHVISSNITSPSNTSFPLTLAAQVKKVGIFPASIRFREPVDVYWNTPPPNMREVHLGSFKLARVNAAAGHGTVNQATVFNIADQDGFGIFSSWLVSKEEFTWRIKSKNLHVEAFSVLPTYKSLSIVKDIVIKGINNFGDKVEILDLQLPGADPQGGLQVITTTLLTNPSPFGIEVGTLNLDLFYKGLYLGPVTTSGLNMTSGANIVTLSGRVLPYPNNSTALAILGELFTNYINSVPSDVLAVGRSTTQANGEIVSWLSTGIAALSAHVAFVPPEPIDPIKGITIETINLQYSEELPYNPTLSSQNLTGTFQLPFGFPLNITQLATSLQIISNGALVGSATGPFADSNTEIQVMSEKQTAGVIALQLPPTMLVLPNTTDAAKKQLIEFQNSFVYMGEAAFQTTGSARALTSTPIGEILLDGIKFDVGAGLKGLAGLTRYPTVINSVDVVGGTKEAVDLVVGLTVVNPSNLNLSTGDTALQLVYQKVVLGVNTLPNLQLLPGRNDVNATATFDPNVSPLGVEVLNRFISGMDTVLEANGFIGSSKIVSLTPSLQGLRLNTTLPALQRSLVQSANLTVLDSTGVADNIANSIVHIDNPFTSGLTITRIAANASARGIFLATIDTQLQFDAAGKATTASPNVPLALNLYPPDLFAVLRQFAVESGQNPAYIDGLVNLAGFTLSPTTAQAQKRGLYEDDDDTSAQLDAIANPGVFLDIFDDDEEEYVKRATALLGEEHVVVKRDNLYTGFNLQEYVGRAFSVATADLVITSDAMIGDYGTTLSFAQTDVPLGTDATLFKLLPILAKPIVQTIVDKSILNIDRVTLTSVRPDGFTATLQGSLTNSGPFDAIVSFPDGLSIFWQGQLLTQTAFPNISLVGDLGSQINVQLEGAIPDVGYFTEFFRAAITDPSFVWDIRGTGIAVDALGISVEGIALTKAVQLTGLNGLKGQIIINSFDLPSNDPAGGIHLTAVSTINNPAQVGLSLSSFDVDIYMGDTLLGPSAAASPFTLNALAVTGLPLAGRIQRQTSQSGLNDLSTLFTRFVHNQNTDLIVQAMAAGPSDVRWLNDGITALRVAVVLPSQEFQVIRVISLNQLSLFFTVPTAWKPQTDSNNTTANFFLPFAFPVDITTVQGPFTARYENTDMAVLDIPTSRTQTDVERRILTLAFTGVPFSVFNNAHQVFSQFSADFVAREMVTFGLHGTANSDLDTAAGTLRITDIPFDLNTNLLGLQGLNAKPAIVSNLDVFHGYPTYLQINVDTTLFNPSDTTVGAGDVTFAVQFDDHIIGNALIRDILLPPGDVKVPTGIQYMPIGGDNIAAGQQLLENYVQNVTSTAIVLGTSQTTPIQSLVQALGQIHLRTEIPALQQLLVTSTTLTVPRDIAQNGGIASVTVTLNNPFTAGIHLLKLRAAANFQNITVGTIDQNLAANNNIINAPGHEVTTSQTIPINLDIRPKNLIRFITAAANAYGVSLGPLPPFFQQVLDLPGEASTQVVPVPDDETPPCSGGNPFDTLGAILRLLKPLQVSIPIESTLKLDDYQTDLNFIQQPVPVKTDSSALYLVGPAAAPLIQLIVTNSQLIAKRANATALTNTGFMVSLLGSLLTDAPADAYIEIPNGLAIEFQGRDIARLSLPPLCTNVPDGIPNLSLVSQLTITDQDAFAEFAYYLLTEPSFAWRLHSDDVTVRTLGIKFSKVQLSKTITLDAFDGLPGITITRFITTGDDANQKRINIETDVAIPSQAALGVELGQATFDLFFGGTNIGQASSRDLFLAYKTTTVATLQGYLRDQSQNPSGLADLGVLFTQYLAGQNSTLTIKGNNVVGPSSGGQPIGWLTTAFKRFTTGTVLPGHIYEIIKAITLSDLEVWVLDAGNSYNIPATNQQTIAQFANPLVFSLTVKQLTPSIQLSYLGGDTASLQLQPTTPRAPNNPSTGPNDVQNLEFGFVNQTIRAGDHASFRAFFAKLTDTDRADFVLKGTTDTLAGTVIGDIPIRNIPFNVSTSLDGIQSFEGKAVVEASTANHSTNAFLGVELRLTLENPSKLTVHTTDVSLPAVATVGGKQGSAVSGPVNVGRAVIPKLDLYPGTNQHIYSLLQLVVPNDNTAPLVQEALREYISSADLKTQGEANFVPAVVSGAAASPNSLTPYESLTDALAGVKVDVHETFVGLGSLVIQHIYVYLPLNLVTAALGQLTGASSSQPATVSANITFRNDVPSTLDLNRLDAFIYKTGGADDSTSLYARVNDQAISGTLVAATANNMPARTPAGDTVLRNNIVLTRGVLGSLGLIGSNLDVVSTINADVSGPLGSYNLPALPYVQQNIPTSYFLGDVGDVGPCVLPSPGSGSTATSPTGALLGYLGTAARDPVCQSVLAPLFSNAVVTPLLTSICSAPVVPTQLLGALGTIVGSPQSC